MNVPVLMGGFSRRWRTMEGDRISDWVRAGPWFQGGNVLVVRAALGQVPAVRDLVAAEVRGSAQWGEVVRVHDLDPSASASGFAVALATWMNIEAPNLRVLGEALGQVTDRNPRLFIACLAADVTPAPWLQEARRTLDVYVKTTDQPGAALLVLETAPLPSAGSLRVDLAWPVPGVGAGASERWSAYLHERVAWHSGGDLDCVAEVAELLDSIEVGDDLCLEDALDGHARRKVLELDSRLRARLAVDLVPALNDPRLCLTLGLQGPEIATLRPAPWLARGLLLMVPNHPRRRFLASLRTCRPLANRLLGRCMDLEQDARDRLLAAAPGWPAAEKARGQLQRLAIERDHPEHILAPRGRSVPRDAWDVADFNDVIALECDGSLRDSLHLLRKARNALAHGSEVGWSGLLLVERIAGELVGLSLPPVGPRRRRLVVER